MGIVPEPPASAAEREALARLAARRELVRMLRIIETTVQYAACQLADGISPAEAVEVARFTAEQLTAMRRSLERLVELGPDERRELAGRLAAAGWPRKAIAQRLGVSDKAVRDYLRPGPAA
jgi:DNA-binding NarL/FixJ family response regulator